MTPGSHRLGPLLHSDQRPVVGRTKFSTITIPQFTTNRRGQGIGNRAHDLTKNNRELNSTQKLPPSPVTSPGNASKSQTMLLRTTETRLEVTVGALQVKRAPIVLSVLILLAQVQLHADPPASYATTRPMHAKIRTSRLI